MNGRLVYSTCALNPKENEEVCAEFLLSNSNFEQVDISSVVSDAYTKNKTVTLMPHTTKTDGFFIAAFERRI